MEEKAAAKCHICGLEKKPGDLLPSSVVRSPLSEFILKNHPGWSKASYICIDDLNRMRTEYTEHVLEEEKGELSKIEKDVMKSLRRHETLISRNINAEFDSKMKIGEKVADLVSEFGGSWKFVIGFLFIIAVWIMINSIFILWGRFDPYPFILLNLVLSCLAALQAPVIMMSQRRQESRDRIRAEHDYKVNLKAELEIRHLHEKVDHLITSQWQKLMEIQQIQIGLMEDLAGRKRPRGKSK
jgi:uncharacterized membrane protein